MRSEGYRHDPPDVIACLARGDPIDPAQVYFRTALRFETPGGELDWLNRILARA